MARGFNHWPTLNVLSEGFIFKMSFLGQDVVKLNVTLTFPPTDGDVRGHGNLLATAVPWTWICYS